MHHLFAALRRGQSAGARGVCDATITTNAGKRELVLVSIVCSVRVVNRVVANRAEPVEKSLGIVNKTRMPVVIAREWFPCEKFKDEPFRVTLNVDKTLSFAALSVPGNIASYQHSCRVLGMTEIHQIEVAHFLASAHVTTTGHSSWQPSVLPRRQMPTGFVVVH